MTSGRHVLALAALFFLLALPLLPSVTRYHVDEKYYTDAAVEMVQTGDWWTPRWADGTPRFNKPIFTYWAVAAGLRTLGIGLAQSRAASLIAGCLVLGVGYGLGRTLFRSREAGLGAAILLFGNEGLYTASLRATPDVFLCLFLNLSLLGFARLLFTGERKLTSHAAAYLGAALALISKGFLGLLAPAYGFGFALASRRRKVLLRKLLEPRTMLLAAATASFWFVAVIVIHGGAAWRGFFADQVGIRVASGWVERLTNAFTYAWLLPRDLMPWTIGILFALLFVPRQVLAFLREHRRACLYVGFWYLLLFLIFSNANLISTRYLLPTYPLLLSFAGGLFGHLARDAGAARRWRGLGRAGLGVVWVLGAALLVAGIFVGKTAPWMGVLWLGAGTAATVAAFRLRGVLRLLPISLFLYLCLWGYDLTVRPVFGRSPAPEAAERLRDAPVDTLVGVLVKDRHLAQIRLLTGGKVHAVKRDEVPAPGELPEPPWLLVWEPALAQVDSTRYRVEPCGLDYEKIQPEVAWRAIRAWDRPYLYAATRRRFYLCVPRDLTPPRPPGGDGG